MKFICQFSLASILGLALAIAGSPCFSAADDPDSSLPPALMKSAPLGEELEVIQPKQPRGEKLQDRLHAAALFAHGRLLQNREDYAGALRRYQRAWRYHPEQVSILDSIVPLAFELKRNGEAARYAVIAAERNPKDSALLRRLAMFLAQQEDYERATALYERAIELAPEERTDVSQLVIRLELGRLYLMLEDFEKSAEAFLKPADALENPEKYDLTENFQKALVGDPEQTYQTMGESFVRAGKYDQAQTAYRKSHAAHANGPLLDYSLARVAAGRGKTAKALKLVEEYLEAGQAVAGLEPYELYGKLVTEQAPDQETARQTMIARLTPLQKADPANAALGVFLARTLADAQQTEAAEAIYSDLLKISPSLEAHNGLISLYKQKGDIPQLLDALGKAAAGAGGLESLEGSAAEIMQDKEMLTALLTEAERRRAENPQQLGEGVALAAGLLAMEAEAYSQVKPFMEIALAEGVPAKSAIVSQWGLGMLIADQHAAAVDVFQKAINENLDGENSAAYYYYLASSLGMDDKLEAAVEAARKSIALRPIPRFKSRIPLLYYYAKKYDKAEQAFKELLAEYGDEFGDPATREVVRDARLVLSTITLKQDRFDEAVEYLEQVLDEYPEDIGAKNDLAYLWADENVHLHRAHAMLREVVAAEPDNLAYRDSLGWVLYRLGRLDEALVELEKATAEEDPDGVILDHLADAHWAAGNHQQARQLWQRAVKAFEESEEVESADEVRQKLQRQP